MIRAVVFPADRPGSALYATLAAQVEAGTVLIVQERRSGSRDRREKLKPGAEAKSPIAREHGERGAQRRVAWAWPEPLRMMVRS